MKKLPGFVEKYAQRDPELYKAVVQVSDTAFSGKALDMKTKLLISLALDALEGANSGVISLAKQAREAGASNEEIIETLRIAYYIAGMRTLAAGNGAFED